MKKLEIPKEVYESDFACGKYIVDCNTAISKINEALKLVNDAKKIASEIIMKRLAATGQDHFAFTGLGTFAVTKTTHVSFPREVDGGKEVGVQWLLEVLHRGLITPDQLLDIQSTRINKEPLDAIEDAVKEYNEQQRLSGSSDLIPDSPFHKYEVAKLSAPRKTKV